MKNIASRSNLALEQSMHRVGLAKSGKMMIYGTHFIISHSLYILKPLFEGQKHFF